MKRPGMPKRRKPLEARASFGPRKPLPKVNRRRRAAKRAERFGEQADRCRYMCCCACTPFTYLNGSHIAAEAELARSFRGAGSDARISEPHHEPTVARGGVDRDTVPLCSDHHTLGPDARHNIGRAEFERRFGIDLKAIAATIHAHMQREKQP